MENCIIRAAQQEDCKAIRNLIQELADFEKMPEGPKINAKDLERDGFGEQPLFQSFVAEIDEKIVGYAIYYYTYSTWGGKSMYLEDLYVIPDVRKKGIGSLLFQAVAKKAVNMNCWRLDFAVLAWNPATDFYKSKGAQNITESEQWLHYRMDKDELGRLAENSKN